MELKNKILKLLTVACGLSLTVAATAVEYNFQTVGSLGKTQQRMVVPQQSSSDFTFLSEQPSVASIDKSLVSVSEPLSSTVVSGGGGIVPAFSSQGATPLYDGFDNQASLAVAPFKSSSLDDWAWPDEFEEAFPPVGEGLASLLVLAGLYVVGRRRRK